MKNIIVPCLLSAGLAAGLAAGGVMLMSDHDASALSGNAESEGRIEDLEDQIAELRSALASRPLTEPAAAPTVRISQSDIEDAVARLLRDSDLVERIAPKAGVTGGETNADPAAGEALDLDQAIALLRDPMSSRQARENMWEALRKAGLIESAIDQLEELIESDPTNPELHAMLGSAFIQKLFGTESVLEKGMVAMQADTAFDQALALDSQHWDARFSKAISLSFWPAITGKGPEAVNQFEQLIAQQEARGDLQPQYAESYLFLGNLYQQQGKADLAQQAWGKGAMLFPDHAGLKDQIGQ